ncbi:MAG: calcium/sodium antiporter [Gammaproteobacteria bacterium]|nr:MAG: calcium/sodium antiporter [Gammaproteobacteria bacterium]RLA12392.1 MAG: calcium/sodium antiporter [Gammaproteobacteria bacterium]
MSPLLTYLIALLIGLALLAWSADRFVDGASALAVRLGVSPMIIGLTIVAFGTSAPEIMVSAMAALNGNPELALGNAVGSNIANIGLVIGVTALIAPLTVQSQTLRREFPLMGAVMVFALVLLFDQQLSRIDGILLLMGMLVLMAATIWLSKKTAPGDLLAEELSAEQSPELLDTGSVARPVWQLVSGLLLLLIASRMLVWGAVGMATQFGISDLVIGLTIVAIGTSLPELAASVVAVRKGADDIAIGNVIGSNMFNLLAVIGVAGTISPTPVDPALLLRDYPLMVLLSMALYLLARGSHGRPGRVGRLPAALLLTVFIAYELWLYIGPAI